MNLVQLVENKDYIGFKDKMEELVEESLLNLFKEAKDEITSKAKVDLDESEDDKEKDDSKDEEQE